jgi:hypothetical protein
MNRIGCAFPELNNLDRLLLSRGIKGVSHANKITKDTEIRHSRKRRNEEDGRLSPHNRVKCSDSYILPSSLLWTFT